MTSAHVNSERSLPIYYLISFVHSHQLRNFLIIQEIFAFTQNSIWVSIVYIGMYRTHTAAPLHFMPCWLSWCRRRSTLRWKPLEQMSHPKGLKPVCFLLWVIRLELWLNALPHTWHLWGFSPTNILKNTHFNQREILSESFV